MIFLSHNSKDKPVVEQIAVKLSNLYGQENIFYDSWSILPGDGIIGKMNEGLENCKIFLFFVSKNSLESEMVKMEWQNALMKKSNNEIKFIPIKLDDSFMPAIMTQNLYINLYNHGLEVAITQIVSVISNNNSFQQSFKNFSNVKAYLQKEDNKDYIEIHAEHYMEPVCSFVFLKDINRKDIQVSIDGMYTLSTKDNVIINSNIYDIIMIKIERALVPKFPIRFIVESTENKEISIRGVMHEKEKNKFENIPLVRKF